jgi:tRNA U34 5-methylaminomethyl-2-thiouridine-forming methyltransferase MnmC
MSFELVTTADGSWSCRDDLTGELCHNRAGAYTESVHFYVRPSGLLDLALGQGHIRVLDACYGLGYNSWALINELLRLESNPQYAAYFSQARSPQQIMVSLVCIEQSAEVLRFLPQVLDFPTFHTLKQNLAPSEHNTYYRTLQCFYDTKGERVGPRKFTMEVAPNFWFELELWVDDLRTRVPQLEGPFDAVFHDPFSPQKMPELWTMELFAQYYRLLQARQGKLLTYGAAAAVRGGMREAGFSVMKTPGLGTKGGGTLAFTHPSTPEAQAEPFEAFAPWEHEYLQSKAGIPYRDPGLCLPREEILARRQSEQMASSRPSGGTALKQKPDSRLNSKPHV